jgi:hypothetical protein
METTTSLVYYDLADFKIRKNGRLVQISSRKYALEVGKTARIVSISYKNGKIIINNVPKAFFHNPTQLEFVTINSIKIFPEELKGQLNGIIKTIKISGEPVYNKLNAEDFKNGEIDLSCYCPDIPEGEFRLKLDGTIRSTVTITQNAYGQTARKGVVLKVQTKNNKRYVKLQNFGNLDLDILDSNMPKQK